VRERPKRETQKRNEFKWEKARRTETVLQVEATILSPSQTKIEQKQEN